MLAKLRSIIASFVSRVRGTAAGDDTGAEANRKVAIDDDAEAFAQASASLQAAIKRIRDTSRWIVVSFAAVAGLIVGTAPLGDVGALEPWSARFWAAMGGFGLVALGVTAVIVCASNVGAPIGLSSEQLRRAEAGGLGN